MSALAFALVAETLALIGALYFLIVRPPVAAGAHSQSPGAPQPRPEHDLDRTRRAQETAQALADARAQTAELKEQLKRVKRERFDQRQSEKSGTSLTQEREQVERAASQQLEAVRAELAQAHLESSRLRSELEMQRGKRAAIPASVAPPVAAPKPVPVPVAEPARAAEPPQHRELNPTELARMELLENRATKDRARATELDGQLKRMKSNVDIQTRLYKTLQTETELLRDKYKALEKRLNRTLLERELTLRAIHQLERESGKVAEHAQATAEELAATDRETEATQKAEAQAEAQAEAAAQAAAAAAPPPPEAPAEEAQKAVLS